MQLLSKLHAMNRYWLLIFTFILTSARSWSQKITLSVDKQPLEKVFLLLEKQSGYSFIYSSEAMEQSRPVTLKVKNEEFINVLTLCFRDQPLHYTTTEGKHVVVKIKSEEKATQINRELRGRILQENGSGASGVTVSIKNSLLVTTTANDGTFLFANAPANVTLLITGAELEAQEIFVGDRNDIIVSVKARVGTLDETIIVGYGKAQRRYLTESVGKVKGEVLTRQPISNPILGLSGRISGLQIVQNSGLPGTNIQVQLRGRNSLGNGNDPLYIIDGVPFPSSPMSGPVGGGGTASSTPLDNINPNSIASIEILKDASATAIYGSRGANGVILITTKKAIAGQPNVNLSSYAGVGKVTRQFDLLDTRQYLAMRREAFTGDGVTPNTANAPDLLLWDTTRYTDWQKTLIGNRMHVYDINASVSAGSETTQYLFATNYRNETTVFPGTFNAAKISGMLNVSHQSSDKKFNMAVSASFQQNQNVLPIDDLTSLIRLPPDAPAIYQADGKLNWEQSTWANPFGRVRQQITSRAETWRSSLQMGYRILPQLTLQFSGGYTSIAHRDHAIRPARSLNPATSALPEALFGRKDFRTLIGEPQLLYSPVLHGKHHLDILVGASFQHSLQTGLAQLGRGYTSDDLLGSLFAAATITNSSETDVRYRYAAGFSRINYDFARKYLLSLTLRRDGSSRYAPNNRFATFGSIGAGWIFSQEKFLADNKVLNFGKLRLSAGWTGNDQIGDYRYLDLYSPYTYSYLSTPTFTPTQLYSPVFGWERVNKLEAGLDLSFFKERLSFTINYYHNTTTDQLVSYSLPSMTGFSGVTKNLPATIRNTGFEFEANSDLIKHKKFRWSVALNFTVPKNKLVSFDNFASSTYANTYALGRSLFVVKTYDFTGVDPNTGLFTFRDYDNNGTITDPADYQYYTDLAPKYYGGVNQTFNHGRFTLHVHVQFTNQPYGKNYRPLFLKPGALSNQPFWVLDRWQKPGQVTDIQKFSVSASAANLAYNKMTSSNAIYSNASFVRLKNLQLVYKLINKKVKTDIFIQGQNLVTITRYKGLDPETQSFVPPVRLITGGFQFNF